MSTRTTMLLLALAWLPVSAGEPPAPGALLERAIAVHGGRAALAAWPDLELAGTYESLGRRAGRRSDLLLRERADGAYRREITLEFRGREIRAVQFYDGQAVKRRFSSAWDDLPLDESVEQAAHRLPYLLGLEAADARFDGEAVEADVPVWLLSFPDGRDRATLALAQDDGRLVALEYPGTSASGMGTKEDVRRKVVYRDHREVGALLLPFDVETLEDGQPVSRVRYETIEPLASWDPDWLRVPDPTRRFIPSEELAF